MQPQPISGRIKPGYCTGFGASRGYIIVHGDQLVQGHLSLFGLRSLAQVGGFNCLGGDVLIIKAQLLIMGDDFCPYFFQVAVKLFKGGGLGLGGSLALVPIVFFDGLFQAQFAPGFVDHYTGEDRIVSILVLADNKVYAKGVVTSHFDTTLGE
jgi:hypothetical protein